MCFVYLDCLTFYVSLHTSWFISVFWHTYFFLIAAIPSSESSSLAIKLSSPWTPNSAPAPDNGAGSDRSLDVSDVSWQTFILHYFLREWEKGDVESCKISSYFLDIFDRSSNNNQISLCFHFSRMTRTYRLQMRKEFGARILNKVFKKPLPFTHHVAEEKSSYLMRVKCMVSQCVSFWKRIL